MLILWLVRQGVTVPVELLEDVQQLHRRLEDAVTASDRVCRRREDDQLRCSTPPPELTLALTVRNRHHLNGFFVCEKRNANESRCC